MCNSSAVTFGQGLLSFIGYGVAIIAILLAALGVHMAFSKGRPRSERISDLGLVVFLVVVAFVATLVTSTALRVLA